MCCHKSGLPPLVGSKNGIPSVLSRNSANVVPERSAVAIMLSTAVPSCAQTNNGIRVYVIPGARILMIVVKKFSPVMVELMPIKKTARAQSDVPGGPWSETGGYSVQPASGAPTRNAENSKAPATGK